MAAHHPLLLSAIAAGALALGCGASTVQSPSTASSAVSPDTVDAGAPVTSPGGSASQSSAAASTDASGARGGIPVTTHATVNTASGMVDVDVTVTGPAELLGGCQPTLVVHLVDASGTALTEPTPPNSVHCLAITDLPIAAGQTRDFTASVRLPAAHGVYTVQGHLAGGGSIPAVTITV